MHSRADFIQQIPSSSSTDTELFLANQAIIETFKEVKKIPCQTSNLEFYSVMNNIPTSGALPIISDPSFEIDCRQMCLPEALGGESLAALIKKYCEEEKIKFDETIFEKISFTSLATVLPAQKIGEESQFEIADFIPAYKANTETSVMVLQYATTGDIGIKKDMLQAKANQAAICTGRDNPANPLHSSALRATENQNSYNIIFLEFENKTSPRGFFLDEKFASWLMTGSGSYPLAPQVNIRGSQSSNMISSGQAMANNHPRPEAGARTLKKIQMYAVNPGVINFYNKEFSSRFMDPERKIFNAFFHDTLYKLIEKKVQQTTWLYRKAFNQYNFKSLFNELDDEFFEKYTIPIEKTFLLETALGNLAGIDEKPEVLDHKPDIFSDNIDMIVTVEAPLREAKNFINCLNKHFGDQFCQLQYDERYMGFSLPTRHDIKFATSIIAANINVIKEKIDELLEKYEMESKESSQASSQLAKESGMNFNTQFLRVTEKQFTFPTKQFTAR